jgi:putative restriction endonuclease
MAPQNAVVALTDGRWFEFLWSLAADGRLDEVNFWRPLAQTGFRPLAPGEPFFFRLKHPINAIAGYGFFAHATKLPIQLAWEAFQERNGDPTLESFVGRIAEYRREPPLETALGTKELTCLILREARFLPRQAWLSWEQDRGWHPNIVAFKTYDLASSHGAVLASLLKNGRPAELVEEFEPVLQDERSRIEQLAIAREGQGSFRVRVLDAYARRCAMTGERALPVLDAAHIEPYRGPASNHVQNGLALRADIHRLYDAGYLTVTPAYRIEVSRRLKDDFDNGEVYYRLGGANLRVIPSNPAERPSRQALEWHASNVFR